MPTHRNSTAGAARRVLIIVENLPVPFDRRVWRECETLRDAGYKVSVIAPRDNSRAQPSREVIAGVTIYRYSNRHASGGFIAYVVEYVVALVMSGWLSAIVLVREGFDAIQICNPPDLLVLPVAPFKLLGKRLVFDQHDVCPEIYMAQSGLVPQSKHPVLLALYFFEWVTYRLSDAVLVVNESCRAVATGRGRVAPEAVHVVRNGPTLESLRGVQANPSLKNGKRFLLVYVGLMGPQDGIDVLLRAIRHLVALRDSDDFLVRIIGRGPVVETMKTYAVDLGIASRVIFTGPLTHEQVLESVATADVCLCPDPKTPLSDMCSLVKTVEYMSMGKPFVAFNLAEVRESSGDAALYAGSSEEREFAELTQRLLENESLRAEMGRRARDRVLGGLTWDHAQQALLDAYDSVFATTTRSD